MKRLAILQVMALVLTIVAAVPAVATAQGTVVGPNPGNGHYYEMIAAPRIEWAAANTNANAMIRNGCQGYLATITSEQENQWVSSAFGDLYGFWLGGFQEPGVEPPDSGWQWVTGEPWAYTNWAPGEPNDAHGLASEQHLEFWDSANGATWNDEANLGNVRGYIVEFDAGACLQIDIKPGSDPNCINPDAKGVIPVAILSTPDFDATTVDPGTVRLAEAAVQVRGNKLMAHPEDMNGDGLLDLVIQIVNETGLEPGATSAKLRGETFDGVTVLGSDSICIVPPESP